MSLDSSSASFGSRPPLTVPFSNGEVTFSIHGPINDGNFDELTKLAACTVHDLLICRLKQLPVIRSWPFPQPAYPAATHTIMVSGQDVQLRVKISFQDDVASSRVADASRDFLVNIAEQARLNHDPAPTDLHFLLDPIYPLEEHYKLPITSEFRGQLDESSLLIGPKPENSDWPPPEIILEKPYPDSTWTSSVRREHTIKSHSSYPPEHLIPHHTIERPDLHRDFERDI